MGRIKDYQREFVKATFGINVKYFMQLINDGHFTMNLCADTHFFNDVALPLHHITICWDIVLGYYDEWKKHKDIIKARKIENDKLKSFFSDKCGLDMSYVPFNNYQNYFFSFVMNLMQPFMTVYPIQKNPYWERALKK